MIENREQNNNRKVNVKNLVIGFLLGLALMLVIGSNGSGGKYQCSAAGDDPSAVFVIDTQTGQTWKLGRKETLNYGTPQARMSERAREKTTRKRR